VEPPDEIEKREYVTTLETLMFYVLLLERQNSRPSMVLPTRMLKTYPNNADSGGYL
jgi:hypothetical protein